MYVDASEACNDLGFNLGAQATGTTTAREWRIVVTQYSCDFDNLAPDGCTKYFFGPDLDAADRIISTYNFPDSHLANQREKFCIRRERNKCRICYVPAAVGQFDVSQNTNGLGVVNNNGKNLCCGYGDLTNINPHGYDCIIVPEASKKVGANFVLAKFDEFCGGGNMHKKSGFFFGTTGSAPPLITTATSNTATDGKIFTLCCKLWS